MVVFSPPSSLSSWYSPLISYRLAYTYTSPVFGSGFALANVDGADAELLLLFTSACVVELGRNVACCTDDAPSLFCRAKNTADDGCCCGNGDCAKSMVSSTSPTLSADRRSLMSTLCDGFERLVTTGSGVMATDTSCDVGERPPPPLRPLAGKTVRRVSDGLLFGRAVFFQEDNQTHIGKFKLFAAVRMHIPSTHPTTR